MGRMQIHQREESVVLGPCPGCELWTLQYDAKAARETWVTPSQFNEVVEHILQDHLTECSGLQEIMANTL